MNHKSEINCEINSSGICNNIKVIKKHDAWEKLILGRELTGEQSKTYWKSTSKTTAL